MISNIPIYRAKKIDSDKYVFGHYLTMGTKHNIYENKIFTEVVEINKETLSINFPSMLDSQGNKIFASLREDGKGGDIVIFEDRYKSVLKVKDYKFAYPIGCGLRTHIGCKIIGIQE